MGAKVMPEQTPIQVQFQQKLDTVVKELKKDGVDPGQAESFLSDLQKLPPEEFVKTINDLENQITIPQLQENDSVNFNQGTAALRSAGDTYSMGITGLAVPAVRAAVLGDSYGNQKAIYDDEGQKLRTAYPGTSAVMGLAGLGASLRAAPQKALMEVAPGLATKLGLNATSKLITAFGGSEAFAAHVAKSLSQSVITKTAATAAVGNMAYGGTQSLVKNTADALAGNQSFADAAKNTLADTAEAGIDGLKWGGAFAAGGLAASKAAAFTKKSVQKGAQIVGKNFAGKDIQYQMNNTDLMRHIFEKSPESVIAESANVLAPKAQAKINELYTIQNQARNELVRMLEGEKALAKGALQTTAGELSQSVEKLRQASLKDVAGAATDLYGKVGAAYRKANRIYGEKLDAVLQKSTAYADMGGVLDEIQSTLMSRGAMDKSGRILTGSAWAQRNPEAAATLQDYWERMGGNVRMQGGKNALTVNLRDAMEFKKQVGELGNFASGANEVESIFNKIYNRARTATEKADPAVGPINQEYAQSRQGIDKFRNAVGKTEQAIAQKLQRTLSDNKNIFVNEGLQAMADLGDDFSSSVSKAKASSSMLELLAGFKRKPKEVFGQLRDAYVAGDVNTITALENIAAKNPQLRPYLNTARVQAQSIKQLQTIKAQQAISDYSVAKQVSEIQPAATPLIEQAQKAKQQMDEISRVLPPDRIALEQKLGANDFGALQNEGSAIKNAFGADPEAVGALKNAEAARVGQRLSTGKGMEKGTLEQIPILGDTLFALRKTATPIASKVLNSIGKAPKKTQEALASDLMDRVQGTAALPKQSVEVLIQNYGPAAALALYAAHGGEKDIQQAAEELGLSMGHE